MIRLYDDWRVAQGTILRRRDLTEPREVPEGLASSIQRAFGESIRPEQAVARLVYDVRCRGDDALREWTARIDGHSLGDLEVPRTAWEEAYGALSADLLDALRSAADRIRAFHSHQQISSWTTTDLGGILGQRVTPLARAGIYVPGGTAPLPSSLLMTAIPARVAGVEEVVVCTPPGSKGQAPGIILAAAHVAGVDRLFLLGGALAIAAMAYGTASVPPADKIVGAGGLFTTLAKRQVFGDVGIDGLYGPTETIIVADDSADPSWIAADLLAQAEHDVLATAILLTPCPDVAQAVQREVTRQLDGLERKPVAIASLAGQGGIVLTPDLATAVRLADSFAPEHLCLSVREPERWADEIRNAGGLFLGEHSFEVLGDYVSGPSHVMPTAGTARFSSPVSVLDFVKITSIIALDAATGARLSPVAARLARAESLTAHAAAAERRGGSGSWM